MIASASPLLLLHTSLLYFHNLSHTDPIPRLLLCSIATAHYVQPFPVAVVVSQRNHTEGGSYLDEFLDGARIPQSDWEIDVFGPENEVLAVMHAGISIEDMAAAAKPTSSSTMEETLHLRVRPSTEMRSWFYLWVRLTEDDPSRVNEQQLQVEAEQWAIAEVTERLLSHGITAVLPLVPETEFATQNGRSYTYLDSFTYPYGASEDSPPTRAETLRAPRGEKSVMEIRNTMELEELDERSATQLQYAQAWIVLHEACDFLDGQLNQEGGKAVVHCNVAVNRTVAVVTAFLVRSKQITVEAATQQIRSVWPHADPNPIYLRMLEEWELEVIHGRTPGTPLLSETDAWHILKGGTPPASPEVGFNAHITPGPQRGRSNSFNKTPRERSAGVIVVRERQHGGVIEALLIQREDRSEVVLEVPKGHIEHGETSVEAAVRECREETGLSSQIRMIDKLTPLSYLLRNSSAQSTEIQKLVDMYVFCSDEPDLSVHFDESCRERGTQSLDWVSADEVRDGTRPVMDRWYDCVLEALQVGERERVAGRLNKREPSEKLITPGQEILVNSFSQGTDSSIANVEPMNDNPGEAVMTMEMAAVGVGLAVVGVVISRWLSGVK